MSASAVHETASDRPIELEHAVRFVTAASLFDGHDAAINVMRRILQKSGAEVIHLGHNRSVAEIVDAYPTLTEWAESKKDAPTIEETQALNAKYNHMAQTFARALTTYGKLRSEYLGLMSRHPEKK